MRNCSHCYVWAINTYDDVTVLICVHCRNEKHSHPTMEGDVERARASLAALRVDHGLPADWDDEDEPPNFSHDCPRRVWGETLGARLGRHNRDGGQPASARLDALVAKRHARSLAA